MSLVIRIGVNDGPPVEIVTARRVTDAGEAPDAVNLYAVQRFDTRDGYVAQRGDQVEVAHRYGDGAAVLALKALDLVTWPERLAADPDPHPEDCRACQYDDAGLHLYARPGRPS